MGNKEFDNVNRPEHYASGGIECIDAMIAAYGKRGSNALLFSVMLSSINSDLIRRMIYQ